MGNCVLKGFGTNQTADTVKVVTSNGGIIELNGPISVDSITSELPGHAIFRSRNNIFSDPLLHSDELHAGEVYYLLPLNPYNSGDKTGKLESTLGLGRSLNLSTPYRVSCDNHQPKKKAEPEVFPRYYGGGVWKVKLVIRSDELSEILSQESRTEELIESVRTVAKCGNRAVSSANSDQCSVSGSWKGSSDP